jgi:glycosyltransferase involved in cell wall biosynthesis
MKPLTLVQISEHSLVGDCLYRIHEPGAALGRLGDVDVYDVHYSSRHRDELAVAADILVVYLLLDLEIFRVIEQRRRLGRPTFCEINDNFFDVHPWNRRHASWSHPENQRQFIHLMRRSDLVQVSSPFLAELFAPYNPRRVVLPNQVQSLPPPRERRSGPGLVVGWGGSAGHLQDIQSVAPVLIRWLQRHPPARLRIMGMPAFAKFFQAAPADQFEFLPHGTREDYFRFVQSLDVGLAPLLPTPYNRGRSDVKFLEYAAHGVVSVVQRLDPYLGTVRNGETGFLVGRDEEWAGVLDHLAADPAGRERIARQAYEQVSRERRLDQHAPARWRLYVERRDEVRRRPPEGETDLPAPVRRLADTPLTHWVKSPAMGPHYWQVPADSPAELKFQEGIAAHRQQDFAGALDHFQAAIEQAPDYYQAHSYAGVCSYQLGRFGDAQKQLQKAAALCPWYSRTWRALAALHEGWSRHCRQKFSAMNPPLT